MEGGIGFYIGEANFTPSTKKKEMNNILLIIETHESFQKSEFRSVCDIIIKASHFVFLFSFFFL